MSSRPDTTNVNVPPPPPRRSAGGLVAGAVIAMLALGALVVAALYMTPAQESPGAAASPSPTTTPGETVAGATATPSSPATAAATTAAGGEGGQRYQSPLGYSVDIPAGWRRSELQSLTQPDPPRNDPNLLARDVFTRRSAEEEQRIQPRDQTGFPAVSSYTAFVLIYRNPEGLTPREFASDNATGITGGRSPESIDDVTFANRGATAGGKPAARATWRWDERGTSWAIYVEDDQERMWVIGYYLAPRDIDVPAGATDEDLRGTVGTFSAPWLRS